MSATLPRPLWACFSPVLPAVALAISALVLLFAPEIGAAAQVWNGSTAYGHCWLVLPIVLWLIHERRFEAASVPAVPVWWPVALALPLLGLWIAADLLGVMEGRQFALIGFIEVALLAALGPRQWWALSAALLYLIFLVPFGAFLTPALQDFTAGFVEHGLDLLGVPNRVTQFQIEIPEGNFYVAEACAGLRFLIASIAFGALYAVTMFQGAWRRAAFIAVSCVVPVIANGFRGLGIVMLGHVLGSAQAAATDHVLYGWIFFSLVIVALALAGMPFRQDPVQIRQKPVVPAVGTGGRALLAVLPVLAAAAIGPAAYLALDARAQPPGAAPAVLSAPPACVMTGLSRDGSVLFQNFRCGEAILVARTELLPSRANPSAVVRAGAEWAASMVPGHDTDNRMLKVGGKSPADWHLVVDEDTPKAAAYVLFLRGAPALGGLHDRLELARDLLYGVTQAPVSVAVAVTTADRDGGDILQAFLSGQDDLAGRIRAAAP